jgi:hypothetical protein
LSKNNNSISFSEIVDLRISHGDKIHNEGRTMVVTKIKSVEIIEKGKILVHGLWKEEEVSRLLRKFGRNKMQ